MIWRIMDTYDLVKDLEEPFTSEYVWDKMKALDIPESGIKARYSKHLKRLTKQGYLSRIGGKKDPTGNTHYIYEVVK